MLVLFTCECYGCEYRRPDGYYYERTINNHFFLGSDLLKQKHESNQEMCKVHEINRFKYVSFLTDMDELLTMFNR